MPPYSPLFGSFAEWVMKMIEFQNVSFSYDGERPVVENLSFSIGKWESVGLIGANGAG